GTHREYPACRSRGKLLRGSGKIRHGRVTKTNQPPANPARFNRAIIAFFIMTGARVKATTTLKLKRVNLEERTVLQDARDVDTKGAKTFLTAFYVAEPDLWEAFCNWVAYLYDQKHFGPEDPLFPKTGRERDEDGNFTSDAVTRAHWSQTGSVRLIVRSAFLRLHMPAYGPHSFRHMLTHVGMDICLTPRAFKAWSQNFGHSDVTTTFNNYGTLTNREQVDEIRMLSHEDQTRLSS
ncbi:hypothetical protein MWU60_14045, partial [Yoonia sp. F2084L]|nr:hypothetical protein [Yoonia sp. F2084L]